MPYTRDQIAVKQLEVERDRLIGDLAELLHIFRDCRDKARKTEPISDWQEGRFGGEAFAYDHCHALTSQRLADAQSRMFATEQRESASLRVVGGQS